MFQLSSQFILLTSSGCAHHLNLIFENRTFQPQRITANTPDAIRAKKKSGSGLEKMPVELESERWNETMIVSETKQEEEVESHQSWIPEPIG